MSTQLDPRVARERHRRSSCAAVLYGEEYSPEWDEDPENFVPTNLPDGTEAQYLRLVNADLTQPVVDVAASETPVPPSVARGDEAMLMIAQIMQQMIDGQNRA